MTGQSIIGLVLSRTRSNVPSSLNATKNLSGGSGISCIQVEPGEQTMIFCPSLPLAFSKTNLWKSPENRSLTTGTSMN